MMKKWPNFCNIWNLQANLGKNFSAKYTEVYVLVLILWKTNKGVHSKHFRQKKLKKTSLKWRTLPNFRNVWNIKAYFRKTFSLKSIKVYIIKKTILLGFHCFFLSWEYIIYFWSSCIISDRIYHWSANFWSFFASFSPDIQPNITFSTEIIATHSNSLKNPWKSPV